MFGSRVEAYYSSKLNIVCFENAAEHGMFCIPSKEVDVSKIKPDNWILI